MGEIQSPKWFTWNVITSVMSSNLAVNYTIPREISLNLGYAVIVGQLKTRFSQGDARNTTCL